MKRTEKGRIEVYQVKKIGDVIKRTGVPYRIKGKKRNDPDLLFVVKGMGYAMYIEPVLKEQQKMLNIRIKKLVYEMSEKQEYQKTFEEESVEEQYKWIEEFLKERLIKGMFAEEPHYYTKMILTYSLPAEYTTYYEQSRSAWMEKLHLATMDQLELYVLDTGMRRSGQAQEKVYYEGRGIKATMEIKNNETQVKILHN